MSILKLLIVGVLGYLVIALGQALVLEVLLGGRLAADAPMSVIVPATLGTIVSGLVGGYLAGWAGGRQPLRHAAIVLLVLAADAAFVLYRHAGPDPLWFDIGGALTLMLATAAGGWFRSRSLRRQGAQPLPA